MKTTLNLPDDLARRVKVRAAMRNQKLKDTIAMLLEIGLASSAEGKEPKPLPEPVRLKKHPALTQSLAEALAFTDLPPG